MTRALVLSGGGSVGIAWQTGLAAGLARRGVELAAADFIVGTSAGSAVGAQLALGTDLEERLARYRQPSTGTSAAARTAAAGSAAAQSSSDRMARLMAVMAEGAAHEDEVAGRAAVGRFALGADALPEEQFVAGFGYLRTDAWPERYACTAVDAETGEFVVWDVKSRVPLERAVASSCAVPGIFAPITIDGRRYIDGGMRSATNADLAKGHELVVLVSLMSPARMAAASNDPRAARFLARMESELVVLTESGARVETIVPDDQAAATIGLNLMDAAQAPAAAAEGVRQGEAMADQLAACGWQSRAA
ncbi:MAG: Patatin [uncultured Acidimicrobiales bacterium]|uniref:Patatin n=1 Tax=uncultured Acidimicrobiales bacterium TaxID=310071 RepID=A0A6J4IUK3_9ACTN|nr:MAG: Patatin [uncultured Acidimicrobiales bacterium]